MGLVALRSQLIIQFFGPTWKRALIKVIWGFLLFSVVTSVHSAMWTAVDYWPTGFPFTFSAYWGPCPEGGKCYFNNGLAGAADIVIWYLVACLIIFLYKNRKRAYAFARCFYRS